MSGALPRQCRQAGVAGGGPGHGVDWPIPGSPRLMAMMRWPVDEPMRSAAHPEKAPLPGRRSAPGTSGAPAIGLVTTAARWATGSARGGQPEREGRTSAEDAGRLQRAPVGLGELAGDGQAEPAASGPPVA